jgi:hypothetical protein
VRERNDVCRITSYLFQLGLPFLRWLAFSQKFFHFEKNEIEIERMEILIFIHDKQINSQSPP